MGTQRQLGGARYGYLILINVLNDLYEVLFIYLTFRTRWRTASSTYFTGILWMIKPSHLSVNISQTSLTRYVTRMTGKNCCNYADLTLRLSSQCYWAQCQFLDNFIQLILQGARHPKKSVYTPNDVQRVIDYARFRGNNNNKICRARLYLNAFFFNSS